MFFDAPSKPKPKPVSNLIPTFYIEPKDRAEAALPVYRVSLPQFKTTVLFDSEGKGHLTRPMKPAYRDLAHARYPDVPWQLAEDLERQHLAPDATRDSDPRFMGHPAASAPRFEVRLRPDTSCQVRLAASLEIHAGDEHRAKLKFGQLNGLIQATARFTVKQVRPGKKARK